MYIIDDFFDNPDEIRSLALKQEYGKWGHDNYPGYRSKMIPLRLILISGKLYNQS